ncbi:MAG: BatD family protein [Planctomycetes bacterium]|nr:BatD family protein [Planctomycetota bacterium]
MVAACTLGTLVGLCAMAPASAQATVELKVGEREAFVREPLLVEVHVVDFDECEQPTFPDVPDCTVVPLGGGLDSRQSYMVQGRFAEYHSRIYRFELTPHKAGELRIPPVTVAVDGKALQTRAVRLPVRASDADELLAVEISCPRERIYVGQRVRLIMTIWVKPALAFGRRLSGNQMMEFFERSDFGPFPTRVTVGEREWEAADGTKQLYYTYESVADYVPDRPGRLTFDELSVGMSYPVRFGRTIFGDPQVADQRRLRARPKVAVTEVLPLPSAGRPPSFAGAVGTYDLTVTAKPTTVRVGDPIELTIEIRGTGPIEILPAPALTTNSLLTESFRVPRETLAGEVDGNRKRFTQIVRAKRADVTELPPLEYAYFDPDSSSYEIARSDAIPLRVTAAESLAVADLADIVTAPQVEQGRDLRPLDGLRDNERSAAALLTRRHSVRSSQVVAVTLAPPAVFLMVWGGMAYVQSRSGDVGRRRRQGALFNARRRLAQTRHAPARARAREVEAALAGYLADRCNAPPARLTGRAAIDFLTERAVNPETRQRWADVLARCEQASFGGVDADADAIADAARECLVRLERERL